MAPVTSPAADYAVNETGQWFAAILTFGVAGVALVLILGYCRRHRVGWPLYVAIGGTATCLLEPLFDHLYGLWFPSEGWTLFTTYGMHEPIWIAAAYLAVYGGGALYVAEQLRRAPSERTVWRLYWVMVAVAIVAEIAYVKVFESYNYQDDQPFMVLGYPLFLGFINSMSALMAGIVIYRVQPLLQGGAKAALMAIPPLAFAMDAFGSGFIYLAIRHSGEDPSMVLIYFGAITAVLGTAGVVKLLTLLLPPPVVVPASLAARDEPVAVPAGTP